MELPPNEHHHIKFDLAYDVLTDLSLPELKELLRYRLNANEFCIASGVNDNRPNASKSLFPAAISEKQDRLLLESTIQLTWFGSPQHAYGVLAKGSHIAWGPFGQRSAQSQHLGTNLVKKLSAEKATSVPHQPMDNLALVFGQVTFILNLAQQLDQPVDPARFIFKHHRAAHHMAEIQRASQKVELALKRRRLCPRLCMLPAQQV